MCLFIYFHDCIHSFLISSSFIYVLQKVDDTDVTPYVWLSRINPEHWAQYHFPTRTKCCSIVNNMSESFNNYIMASRDLPIVSMWEWIRNKLMTRIVVKYEAMQKYEGTV